MSGCSLAKVPIGRHLRSTCASVPLSDLACDQGLVRYCLRMPYGKKHLHRYLDAFAFQHNICNVDDGSE